MPPKSDTSPNIPRFAVIGGDLRMTHLAERLAEAGCFVNLLGCGDKCLPPQECGALHICTTLQKATETVQAVILPLPATRDGVTVWCPRDPNCRVTLDEIADLTYHNPDLILYGGKLPSEFLDRIKQAHPTSHRVQDYYDSEVLQLRNAAVTAEAALMTAMQLTDSTVRDASVAVVGYGRIGKYLSRLLRALGADVTVAARREEVLFEAAAEGCHPLMLTPDTPMNGLAPLLRGHPIIYNTVPAHILDREFLLGLDRDTLLIDLASAPFGVSDSDVRAASARNGLRYLRAPSLPGSYAPREAGRIIADCILDAWHRQAEQTVSETGGAP